jgi:hypothetical protein
MDELEHKPDEIKKAQADVKENLDVVCADPMQEIAEAVAFENRAMTIMRVFVFGFAGIMVTITPWAVYFGHIYCIMHGLKPPDTWQILGAYVAGMSTILSFGFPKRQNNDSPRKK